MAENKGMKNFTDPVGKRPHMESVALPIHFGWYSPEPYSVPIYAYMILFTITVPSKNNIGLNKLIMQSWRPNEE